MTPGNSNRVRHHPFHQRAKTTVQQVKTLRPVATRRKLTIKERKADHRMLHRTFWYSSSRSQSNRQLHRWIWVQTPPKETSCPKTKWRKQCSNFWNHFFRRCGRRRCSTFQKISLRWNRCWKKPSCGNIFLGRNRCGRTPPRWSQKGKALLGKGEPTIPNQEEITTCSRIFQKGPTCEVCQMTKTMRARCEKRTPETRRWDLTRWMTYSGPQHLEPRRKVKERSTERSHRAKRMLVLVAELSHEKAKMRKKQHLAWGDFCLHSRSLGESTQTISKEFIKACPFLQWTHLRNTPHLSETNKIAERVVPRVKEGTPTARVQSGRPEQWWDRAMECCCHLPNVHDKMADGKTAAENICGVTVARPLMPLSQLRTHLLKRRVDLNMLPGVFMGYVLREGGGWSGDLLLADCEDVDNLSASEIHVQRFKHQEVSQGRKPFRFHVRTGEPSNSLILLDFSVAKCPLGETLSRIKKKPSSKGKTVRTFGACVVTSFVATTKNLGRNSTSRVKQHSSSFLQDAEVMRQTPGRIDNAPERTLNENWNADREVQLSEEWIVNSTLPNLENQTPRMIHMCWRSTHKSVEPYTSWHDLARGMVHCWESKEGGDRKLGQGKDQIAKNVRRKSWFIDVSQNSKHAWFVQDRVFPWRVLEGRTVLQIFCRSKKPELTLISK